jgi:hypothetical protein
MARSFQVLDTVPEQFLRASYWDLVPATNHELAKKSVDLAETSSDSGRIQILRLKRK